MKKKIFIFLKVLFILLIIVSIIMIISWKNDKREVTLITNELKDYVIEKNSEYILDPSIKKKNSDVIGWIIIDGTNISYPVVKTNNNDYYLNHDFNKNYNDAGWIFMDYRNDINDQNLIIYGHHRKDRIMFGDIDSLFDKDYYNKSSGIIKFITEEKTIVYKIFSVYKANSSDKYNLIDDDNFDKHINECKNRSQIDFGEDLSNVKQIITLSTCHNNNVDRLVVKGYTK